MAELTNGRGVTLRTGWVDEYESRGNETRKGNDDDGNPSCPSCGAPLRLTAYGKMYCWFCEKDFDLDNSGSVIDPEKDEGDEDFEMNLDEEEENDPLAEEEELDFDLEIDIETQAKDGKKERSEEVEEMELDQEEEVQWDEEKGSTDIEFTDDEFEIEEDEPEEPDIFDHPRTLRRRKVHIRSDDVEFEE